MAKTAKLSKVNLEAETILIPLDKLDPSPENMRVTMRDADVANLAGNIADEGLLQNLSVTASLDADGEPTGRYEVAVGERRRQALMLLAKQKRLAKNVTVPCRLVARSSAVSASLSENVQRVATHPADEYEAFAKLHEGGHGLSVAQIAERHGVSQHTVKQRLRLGSASPKLMASFRLGTLTLAQLMAFCVTDDQAAQERVFDSLGAAGQLYEYAIRRALLDDKVPLHDRRIAAIGLAAYEAAGGAIARDLFSTRDEGWVIDVDLLNRLAGEKLEAVAETIRAEGWAWVTPAAELPADISCYRRKAPERVPLSPEDDARLSELGNLYDRIEAEGGDFLPGEEGAGLDQIEAEINAIQARRDDYPPELRAETGVFVTFGFNGIDVERGWVRRADCQTEQSHGGKPGNDALLDGETLDGDKPEPTRPAPALSAALVEELLAQRTAGLQVEVARRPDLALRVLLQSLILNTMHQSDAAPCKISVREPQLRAVCPSIDQTLARKELAERKGTFAGWKLPEAGELLPWLLTRGNNEILEMLAVLVAHGMDAGRASWTTATGAKDSAAQVAELAELDMRQWWQPTTETYFGRVSKELILEAMREGAPDVNVSRSQAEKKADMAAAATALLDGKGWLPAALRSRPTKKEASAKAA